MASRTHLMLNDGMTQGSTALRLLGSASADADKQAGIYTTIPDIVVGTGTTSVGRPVECSKYTRAHFMPVSSTRAGATQIFYLYGFYGDSADGVQPSRYFCHLLYSFTATHTNALLAMTSPGGTAYLTSAIGAITAGLSVPNDLMTVGLASGATVLITGTASAIGTTSMSLMGADYVALVTAAPNGGDGTPNGYIRFH